MIRTRFKICWKTIKWFFSFLWCLLVKKPIDWGDKLKDLMKILNDVLVLIDKPESQTNTNKIIDFFKKLIKRK